MRGTIIHKNYFYGSVTLLSVTAAFAVLPLPNVPFFWILFRAYSHWRALKGSQILHQLVSDSAKNHHEEDEKNADSSEALCLFHHKICFFYSTSTKSALVDSLRRWRQAALVLNASR